MGSKPPILQGLPPACRAFYARSRSRWHLRPRARCQNFESPTLRQMVFLGRVLNQARHLKSPRYIGPAIHWEPSMKLKWSIMKQPTMMAFKMFRKQKRTDFMLGVNPIYTRLDTPAIARVPEPGPATETFNALKANWATDAQRLCFPSVPRPSFTLLSEKKKEE